MIVSDPKHPDRHGTVIEDPACTEDLFPTLLGFAGLTPKNPLPGIDLNSILRGEASKLQREGVLLQFVAEHREGLPFHDEVWRGIRTRRFKYLVKGDKFGGKPWQFFDLDKDGYELNNLINDPDYQDEIVHHHGMLCERLQQTEDPFVLLPAFGYDGVNLWREEAAESEPQS